MKNTHETSTETGVKRAVEQMIEATASRCNIIDFANSAHFQLNAMGASEETECAAVKFIKILAADTPCFIYGEEPPSLLSG